MCEEYAVQAAGQLEGQVLESGVRQMRLPPGRAAETEVMLHKHAAQRQSGAKTRLQSTASERSAAW